MAPVKTAAATERPAKRRKMRGVKGDESAEELASGAAKKHGETLLIRGGRQWQRASRQEGEGGGEREEREEDEGEDEKEDQQVDSERESTDSPSAQLAGAVRPRQSRSQTRDETESGSRAASRSAYRSLSRSRSRSRSRQRSASRSQSQSPVRSSPSVLHGRSTSSPRPHYRRVFSMRGHEGAVSQVRISPDGQWIASASADATARIWDAATGTHMTTLVGHLAGLSCLAWSPDSNTLATGSDDKSIRLWDRVTAEPAHALVRGGGEPASGWEEEGRPDGPVDAGHGNPPSSRTAAAARTRASHYARSSRLDSAGAGGARGSRLPLLGHHNYVYCLAFSPKGNILASGSYDEAVFLWDVRAGRLMRSLPAHSDPVSGIGFCCDGTLVVSCSTDGLIRIWDTATGQCLRTLLLIDEDNPAVSNVCFSPNGRYVLAFNLDSCVRLWDYVAQPSIVKKTYQGHLNKAFSIGGCFGVLESVGPTASQDDASPVRQPLRPFVAAASEDGDVVLWDVGTKAVVQRLRRAHKGGVCFWVDVCGATMVSCGQDGWINVYQHGEAKDVEEPTGGLTSCS
ncbi:WD repeat protein [Grosmannia clavigera kw1407]|uniref:Mitochondrial division protein 1 n=1 Tax=Grosmannia clavigera (strain kw1407 / UAMH 11150) TaxID=655863 RepID=F0XEZ7_GROCL|nr:WD repeat protein [Grosmannia clavigera kw1407]EFX04039.1 WD repeat protein [Grosmannia clavigera kw1407]